MKKFNILFLTLAASALLFSSCDEDTTTETFDVPTVSGPTNSSDIAYGATAQSVNFSVTSDAAVTATYAATKTGGITITNGTALAATEGVVTVTFDSGTTPGAASITLTLTDSEGQTANATAVMNILQENDNAITISEIPATAQINLGQTLTVDDITMSGTDGVASLEISVNGTVAITEEFAGTNATETYDLSYTPEEAGVYSVVFKATDSDGDEASFTHALSVIALEPVTKAGLISANETWTNDRIYILNGRVIVADGVELTIEPGTIIKGKQGTGSLASALVISRGGKIKAEGTAESPIVFTSELDNIAVGQKVGTNLTATDNQKWGGLMLLGKAPISATSGDVESSIEGLPANETYGLYGGSVADDNSGVLKYISIRHGGSLIGATNEINGLTLGGVGSGTIINYVEVYGTLDDGIELFGGTVNVTNLLVYAQGDDGVDIDQNYAGTVDNFAVYQIAGVATDKGLEIDGPENTTHTGGLFTLKNGLVKGVATEGGAADLKAKAQGTIQNVFFTGYADAKYIRVRTAFTDFCQLPLKTDAYTYYTSATPKLIVKDCQFSSSTFPIAISVFTDSKTSATPTDPSCPVDAANQTAVDDVLANATYNNSVAVTTGTVGADMAAFTSWTAASLRSQL